MDKLAHYAALAALLASSSTVSTALAQDAPPAGGGDEGAAPPAAPPAAAPRVTVYPGGLPPPGFDPDSHLPAGSRSTNDISRSRDGFDFSKGGGPPSVRGGTGGSYILEGNFVPEAHAVKRGDTLWEISNRYYGSPYQWPRIWGMNGQIQNPHWIYPGDRVRLRDAGDPLFGQVGFGRRRLVPPQTIFLRDVGWIDDKKEDTWGEVVGAPGDHMMLLPGEEIYIQLNDDHQVNVGDELTIFRPIRTVAAENAKGELISIRGTAKIDRYNSKTKMARAKVIEGIDTIERGAKVGPVTRKFDVVPPVAADKNLEMTLLASVYPHRVYGNQQVVFVDKGEKDGLKPGHRVFAIQRGDRWAEALPNAGALARYRPRVEDDKVAEVDKMPSGPDRDKLPDETYAELRIMRVRDHTATAVVVQARYEIERGAKLFLKKGY